VLRALGARERALFTVLSALVLGLGAHANPVADALHPANLELCALAATQLVLMSVPRWSPGPVALVGAVLGAGALLVKQPTGAAVLMALCWGGLTHPSATRAARGAMAAAPLAAGVAVGLLLHALTGDGFKTWAIDVLAAQPFEWWKVRDLYAGYFLLFAPALLAVLASAVAGSAVPRSALWDRAAVVAICTAPVSLAALFKAMGGPNNLAVLGWVLLVLALPHLLGAFFHAPGVRRPGAAGLAVLLVAQIALIHPRRRTPEPSDHQKADLMCEFAAARSRCGEHVFLGRGAMCLHRGGVAVPRDRMMAIMEATLAGRQEELGFTRRLRESQYDLMIFGVGDLQWGGKLLWELMRDRYRPFFTTHGELEGDFWFHGWQGFVTWPVVYFERLGERGRHEVSARGMGCAFDGRR
jgi:hypothetical protein